MEIIQPGERWEYEPSDDEDAPGWVVVGNTYPSIPILPIADEEIGVLVAALPLFVEAARLSLLMAGSEEATRACAEALKAAGLLR